jgi:hypothetical protein
MGCNCSNNDGNFARSLTPRCTQTSISADILADENDNILTDNAGTGFILAQVRAGSTAAFEYERLT